MSSFPNVSFSPYLTQPAAPTHSQSLPAGWTTGQTGGKTFYIHPDGFTTQWEHPSTQPNATSASQNQKLAEGWVAHSSAQGTYYAGPGGKTQWEHPGYQSTASASNQAATSSSTPSAPVGGKSEASQRGGFFAKLKIGGGSSKEGQRNGLVIGCGREGTRWNSAKMNEQHQHARNGEATVDIEPGNNPDVLASITDDLRSNAEFVGLGPVPEVKIEALPHSIYDSPGKRQNIIGNIGAVTTAKHKLKATCGADGAETNVRNFVASLQAAGYQTKEPAIKKGVWEVKAEKK